MTLDRTIAPALHWGKKVILPPCIEKEVNGISFTFFLDPNTSIVTFRFIFPRIDTIESNPVVAQAAMEMLLRGTETKNTQQLFQAFEVLGAQIRTSVTRDYNSVTLSTTLQNVEEALTLLHEVFFAPRMLQEDLEQWIEENKAEFVVNLETPSYLSARAFLRTLYGTQHFYGKIRQLKDYDSLTLDDIKRYWQSNIVNNIPRVIVIGGLSETAKSTPITAISSWNFGKPHLSLIYGVVESQSQGIVRTTVSTGTQVSLYMGYLLPPHPFKGEYDLRIAIALLGGVFSSRLMQNLREDKGYTYGIRADITNNFASGEVIVRTNVGNEYASLALAEIRKEIDRMSSVPASQRELEILRGQLLGDIMQGLDGVWDAATGIFLYGFPVEEWFEHTRNKIDALSRVTANDIVSIAREWLTQDRFLLSVSGKEDVVNSLDW